MHSHLKRMNSPCLKGKQRRSLMFIALCCAFAIWALVATLTLQRGTASRDGGGRAQQMQQVAQVGGGGGAREFALDLSSSLLDAHEAPSKGGQRAEFVEKSPSQWKHVTVDFWTRMSARPTGHSEFCFVSQVRASLCVLHGFVVLRLLSSLSACSLLFPLWCSETRCFGANLRRQLLNPRCLRSLNRHFSLLCRETRNPA